MKRVCIERGCPLFAEGDPRCEGHRLAWQRTRRGTTAERGYGAEWQRYARERIATVGYCQGQPCPYPDCGTSTNPLTVDHRTLGLVLCRRANSAKQHADKAQGGRSAT
jgi:hypothetical protein